MRMPDKDAFLSSAAGALEAIYEKLAHLPAVSLDSLEPQRTVLFVVDMVEGFAVSGAMSSPRVGDLISPIAGMVRRCAGRGIPAVAFADTHTADSLELASYPPHCLRGTAESRVCAEIAEAGKLTLIEKNSTNGMAEPAFQQWMANNGDKDTYIVVGDCTDICVYQFAVAAKTWHNARNRPLRVIVPLDLVDTYDAPGHDAALANACSLYSLMQNGIEVCRSLC